MIRKLLLILLNLGLIISCAGQRPPNKEAAYYNTTMGLAYLKQSNFKLAKTKLLLAMIQAPKDIEVLAAMGYFFEKTGEPTVAEQYYRHAIKIDPKSGETHNNYGTYLCRRKRYQEAVQQFLIAAHNPNYLNSAAALENAKLCNRKK